MVCTSAKCDACKPMPHAGALAANSSFMLGSRATLCEMLIPVTMWQ